MWQVRSVSGLAWMPAKGLALQWGLIKGFPQTNAVGSSDSTYGVLQVANTVQPSRIDSEIDPHSKNPLFLPYSETPVYAPSHN